MMVSVLKGVAAALLMHAALASAAQETHVYTRDDFILAGGATFMEGKGAPNGYSLRTGAPGQVGDACGELPLATTRTCWRRLCILPPPAPLV